MPHTSRALTGVLVRGKSYIVLILFLEYDTNC
jgi:hypothetical protein